jgi:hypothetical protein
MSSSEDAKREKPLAEETTKNIRPPRPPARSGVVERVEERDDEDARETARLPSVSIGPVTEIAPPPSHDPRRE